MRKQEEGAIMIAEYVHVYSCDTVFIFFNLTIFFISLLLHWKLQLQA